MSKKEMVKNLAKEMKNKKVVFGQRHRGFKSVETFDYEEELYTENYQYLEEQNLSQMIDVVKKCESGIDFTELHKKFSDEKLLKVKPKLVEEYPPFLVFGQEAFLSWFRGYRFQVSGNTNGTGDYGSSATTLERDLLVAKTLPKELRPLISFSHVCEATNKYQEFNEILWNDSELINSFMVGTDEYERIRANNFDLDKVKGMFKLVDELPERTGNIISFCETTRKGSVDQIFGMMAVGESFIAFRELKDKKWTLLEIPVYSNTYEDLYEVSKVAYYEVIWKRFAYILVSYSSIRLYYSSTYPTNKEDSVTVPVNGIVTNNNGLAIIGTNVIRNSNELDTLLEKKSQSLRNTEKCISGRGENLSNSSSF